MRKHSRREAPLPVIFHDLAYSKSKYWLIGKQGKCYKVYFHLCETTRNSFQND